MSKLTRLAPRRSLHEQAYEVIREFVLGGGIPPGGVVSASQIAHELGVSATPVKEALGRLAAQGLVQVLPQRGVRLAEATPADIADLYDFREGLEAMSLALAPRPFPAEALAQLAGLVAECERYVAAEDRRRYTQADIRFHEVLVRASGNRQLVRAFQALQSQIQVVRLRAIVLPGRPLKSHLEHRAIVEALATDRARAERAVRAHIRNVKLDVLRAAGRG